MLADDLETIRAQAEAELQEEEADYAAFLAGFDGDS